MSRYIYLHKQGINSLSYWSIHVDVYPSQVEKKFVHMNVTLDTSIITVKCTEK
jgi:hypothetical protein